MRNNIIVGFAVFSFLMLVYLFTKDDDVSTLDVSKATDINVLTGNAFRELDDKITNLHTELAAYYSTNNKQIQQALSQQKHVNKKLLSLSQRIEAIQIINDNIAKIAQSNISINEGKEKNIAHTRVEATKPEELTESDLGQWIDNTIELGNVDENLSALANEQALLTVADLSSVNLDELSCGEKVCRAILTHEPGEREAVHDLFGKPPFDNEGFTVEEEDGRVLVYFTQPGVTMKELRVELLQ